MTDKKNQNWWKVDNIADIFKDISFAETESNYYNSKCNNVSNNKQDSIEELKDDIVERKQIENGNNKLYVGVMRKCDVEDYLRSFIGINFCFYHNFKASKSFIRYSKRLKLYYAFKNEVDLIHHSEIKYHKKHDKFTFKMRPSEKKSFNSFEELVNYCSKEMKKTCC